MEDVAKAAGVSTATVSRVLNTPTLVASETAARVQRAIETLGYKPNVFAQGLMTRRSHLLGILLPDIHGEFYSELLRGADGEARRQGYHLLISSEARDPNSPANCEIRRKQYLSNAEATDLHAPLFSANIVGFMAGLALMITEPNEALLKDARESGLPLVVIDEDMNGERIDRVLVDNQTGTREAVEHLLESVKPGDCSFVGGPRENFDTADRARAFLETLASHGHKATGDQLHFGEYSVEWGTKAGEQLLTKRSRRPIGILAANDEIAFGLLHAARDRSVGVPGEVRIVGFDDTRLASLARPQLSSVRVPMADLGAAAVKTLIERLQNPERNAVTLTLPTRLVVRGTSRVE